MRLHLQHVVNGVEVWKAKVQVPDSWAAQPCSRLCALFVQTRTAAAAAAAEASNAASAHDGSASAALCFDELVMRRGDVVLQPHDTIGVHLHDYNTVTFARKATTRVAVPDGAVRCVRNGCGKLFVPAHTPSADHAHAAAQPASPDGDGDDDGGKDKSDDDAVCRYHSGVAVFHDTAKYWSCCPQKKAYDWDAFEQLPTCCVGVHSDGRNDDVAAHAHASAAAATLQPCVQPPMPPPHETAAHVATTAAATAPDDVTVVVAPTSGRVTGPREFDVAAQQPHDADAEASAASAAAAHVASDGTAICRNHGCGKRFVIADNDDDTACRHHARGPVFWDTYKYWACCPTRKCADFDDFVHVEGCCVGRHTA